MTGNKIFALFSALAGVALAGGHDLGAVEIERRFYGYEPEPASWCFTYYSCYLAPLETGNLLPGSPVVTTITSIVQVPTTIYPTLPTPILTTPLSGLPTPSSLSPSPSPLPGPEEVIFAIIPTVLGRSLEKRRLDKRDLGGFISDVGSPNPKDCRFATVFRLDNARLQLASRLGASVFADAGTSFTEFRTRDSFNAGANIVSTTFLNDNLLLRWRNASFSGGEAGFCQVPATGQVYATFVDSPTQLPAGCLPARLAVLDPRQCVGGDTTSSSLPGTTSISSVVASTQSIQPPSSSATPPTSIFTTTPSTPPPPVESSSTEPSSEPIPPATSSASSFPSLPPFMNSTSLSLSSQTSGTTESTASTESSQSASTDSSSQSAPTESSSQPAPTESTSQSASTESSSQSAPAESTSSGSSSSVTPTSQEPFSTTTTSEITTTGTSSTYTSFTFFGNSTTQG